MGSPATEKGRNLDEAQRSVTLTKGFYMGIYPVTQEQYEAVMGVNPSTFLSNPASGEIQGRRPVETVSWFDAIVFCNRLSLEEGKTPAYEVAGVNVNDWKTITAPAIATFEWNSTTINPASDGYRLPTEAQWEYACRARTTTAFNDGVTNLDFPR
jgi:formylglycine-generating enzyme required for sulfatase activity